MSEPELVATDTGEVRAAWDVPGQAGYIIRNKLTNLPMGILCALEKFPAQVTLEDCVAAYQRVAY